ncbi:hypothetical protein NIES25_27570 [Nostoc linckia NIES-25]|nr:hypothetical protein NIES25_27570 [Nostoc linckia NIES-25]
MLRADSGALASPRASGRRFNKIGDSTPYLIEATKLKIWCSCLKPLFPSLQDAPRTVTSGGHESEFHKSQLSLLPSAFPDKFNLSPFPRLVSLSNHTPFPFPMPHTDASCGSSSNMNIHRRLEKEENNISNTFSSSKRFL